MVLDAALGIFAEGGFAEASMAAIASRSGITKPVLYDCFPDGKQEIFLSLIEREEERFLDHMTEALTVVQELPLGKAIRTGLAAFLDYVEHNPDAFVVLFGQPGTADLGLSTRAERVRERMVELMNERAAPITEGLENAAVIGEIYTRSIIAIADHLSRWWLKERAIDREVIVATVSSWLMKGLEGFVPPERLAAPAAPKAR